MLLCQILPSIAIFAIMMMKRQKCQRKLNSFIQCYNKNLWTDDTVVPRLWIEWYQTLKSMNSYDIKIIFDAVNADQYAKNIEKYFPYLTKADCEELYNDIMQNEHIVFAGAPLINESYCHTMLTGKDKNQFYLYHNANYETNSSELKFHEKAIAYAKQNWQLILKPEIPFYKAAYAFNDPAISKSGFGGCEHKFTITVALNEPYDDIDHDIIDRKTCITKADYENINEHIVLASYNDILSAEIIAPDKYSTGRPYPTAHPSPICIYDGSTLGPSSCDVCKREFPETTAFQFKKIPIGDILFNYLITNEAEIRDYNGLSNDAQIVPNEELLQLARSMRKKKSTE